MKKLFTFVLAGAMILSMAGCSSSHSESAPPVDSSAGSVQQESAADIQDPDLFKSMETVDLEGNQVDTSVFAENKVTLVNVWNVGCTPCIQELGILDALNKEYEGKGAAIRGLYYSFSSEISEEERSEIRIPAVADVSGDVRYGYFSGMELFPWNIPCGLRRQYFGYSRRLQRL